MSNAICLSSAALCRWAIMLGWLGLCVFVLPAQAARVTVYTNATFAPLVIDGKSGLYPDLVAYLNSLNLDGIEFVLESMPRKRLQAELENGSLDGIVIGMTPQWVGDPAQEKYLWTEPFAHDGFVLVSRHGSRYAFGQTAAPGLRIGVTLGYVYPGVDEWIERSRFVRDNAPTEERNLDKLALGRVDMIVVTSSVFRHYVGKHSGVPRMVSEVLPGKPTERRILVPRTKRTLYEKLAPAIRALAGDHHWKSILSRY